MPVAIVVLSLQHQRWSYFIRHELSLRHEVFDPPPSLYLLAVYLPISYLAEGCIDPVLVGTLAGLDDLVVVGLLYLPENCLSLLGLLLEVLDLVGQAELDLFDGLDLRLEFLHDVGIFLESGKAKAQLILVLV